MLIDTHAHLNFAAFEKDKNKVIEKCLENDIWIINIGTNFETSRKAVDIAQKYSQGVYASIGLHPINLDTGLVKIKVDEQEGRHFEKEFDFEKYKRLALLRQGSRGQSKNPKVVAIGEIGLDYYWKPKTTRKKELFKKKQKDLLFKELKLAKELNLPVIFHCRMAHNDLVELLSENLEIRPEKAVAHGFVGNSKELQKYLDFGFYIGFNGIIFKNIEDICFEENIKQTPLERIVIETDCPYLTPPQKGDQRNKPLYVKYIAQRISQIKNINFEKVAEITTENAKTLFKF